MTSYRLFLLRAALGRFGRAVSYYWVSLRAQLRMWRSSYHVALLGQRVRGAAGATGRLLLSVPRRLGALLGLVVWFGRQLPPYLRRVLADRREDRLELRAERRLIAAQRRAGSGGRRSESAERRARRRAELAEIKANRTKRPHHVQVPAWISRIERPERPQRQLRVPAPRRAMFAAALTMLVAVPAYAVVSGVMSSDDMGGAVPDVASAPGAAAVPPATGSPAPAQPGVTVPGTAAPTAPPVAASGDTGEFVRTLPPLPTAAPRIPAPRLTVAAPGTNPAPGAPVLVGSLTKPLSDHQAREARRQAKWDAKLARTERTADNADRKAAGK